ncbi:hypothetical protein RchiOBHm_Chr6g0283231 [Rosa chinensis]|uniref:Uncharacterized protein n=1 Tax=Rosa chinensis TaxID=74649 RepID=A0A2P6PTY4_ROSCH|nr:hypothetical protein RchiOBHm_Chr6g0283231 [Rosa chinensis]
MAEGAACSGSLTIPERRFRASSIYALSSRATTPRVATPEVNWSPYQKLNSIKRSDRYRSSPEFAATSANRKAATSADRKVATTSEPDSPSSMMS